MVEETIPMFSKVAEITVIDDFAHLPLPGSDGDQRVFIGTGGNIFRIICIYIGIGVRMPWYKGLIGPRDRGRSA